MTHLRILHYNFSIEEVLALNRLITHHLGFLPREDEEVYEVMNRITEIVKANELATKYRQTT